MSSVMRKSLPLLLILICLFFPIRITSAQPSDMNQIIKSEPPAFSKQMIQISDLIVYAHLDEHVTKWDTGRRLASGAKLINAAQHLHIRQTLKGRSPVNPLLVTTGVDPLPPPQDPLNNVYTGPLADGDYILFLKSFHDAQHFILNGGFTAVYPVVSGKMIALDQGFKEFDGLTLSDLSKRLHDQ